MLDSNFFSLSGTNRAWNVNELSLQISLVINFFLCEVTFSWKANLVAFLYLDDDEDRLCVIPANDFIDLNVCLLRLWPG